MRTKGTHDDHKKRHLLRRGIKRRMGKPVFLTLSHTPHPLQGYCNRYIYKATLYRTNYRNAVFENVKWQASNITSCSFRGAHLKGVDFCNTNLHNTSFKDAYLDNVVFYNCKLKDTNFSGAKLSNVIFASSNVANIRNFTDRMGCTLYNTYPKINIDSDVESKLLGLSNYADIYYPHVLHVNKRKLNHWTLQILYDNYGINAFRALTAINDLQNKRNYITVFSYKVFIEKYLNL